jgi:glycine/D-amino acid oxidase-like deaminating enzyme
MLISAGGGIIGSTTAYFLSHHEKFNKETDTITLLEATKIAGGASGKAGGLLALWYESNVTNTIRMLC